MTANEIIVRYFDSHLPDATLVAIDTIPIGEWMTFEFRPSGLPALAALTRSPDLAASGHQVDPEFGSALLKVR